MTLTKNDLQAIKEIVKETVDESVEQKLEHKLENKLKPIKKDITFIKKTLNLIIGRYDPIVIDHEKRIDKVERVLKIARE